MQNPSRRRNGPSRGACYGYQMGLWDIKALILPEKLRSSVADFLHGSSAIAARRQSALPRARPRHLDDDDLALASRIEAAIDVLVIPWRRHRLLLRQGRMLASQWRRRRRTPRFVMGNRSIADQSGDAEAGPVRIGIP